MDLILSLNLNYWVFFSVENSFVDGKSLFCVKRYWHVQGTPSDGFEQKPEKGCFRNWALSSTLNLSSFSLCFGLICNINWSENKLVKQTYCYYDKWLLNYKIDKIVSLLSALPISVSRLSSFSFRLSSESIKKGNIQPNPFEALGFGWNHIITE